MKAQVNHAVMGTLLVTLLSGVLVPTSVRAQDRLKLMPGYDQYTKANAQLVAAGPLMVSGSVLGGGGFGGRGGGRAGGAPGSGPIAWAADGKGFDYTWNTRKFHFDLATRKATELPSDTMVSAPVAPGAGGRGGRGGGRGASIAAAGPCSEGPIDRGRQATIVASPDGKFHAMYRDRNLFMGDAECGNVSPITSDGSEKERIKYGSGSWVYGEELGQTSAMWWNPTGTRLAYYRFDESKVPDFYITQDETRIQTKLDVEAYPKPGVPNPVADLFVYDLATKRSTRIDVRDGKPFTNDVVGHYAYQVGWSPDGKELLFNRTNRRQNIIEFVACSPETGRCRVIIREEWPTGWVENHPPMRYLADSTRFIWQSERNGFKNLYLYDLSGRLINPITQNQFEVASIVRVDEKANTLWYMGRDGDNFMKLQLHKVGLDGRSDRRLTDPAFTHQVDVSPDGKYFVDVAQTHDQPPLSQLVDVAKATPVAQLAKSDISKMESLGVRKIEVYSFLAADGKTRLFGAIEFPLGFDPAKKYPALAPVYGGPASGGEPSETFRVPTAASTANYGFLVLSLHTRATPGMGKRTLDALYLKLGQTEIDDMAAGVKALWDRPYFDKNHVGIYGTSYGGYSSVMAILRYPDVFAAASSESPVTDWRHYDTIYTERYMWIPEENTDGYDKGSAMQYVANLKGELLLYYGSIDNNVHNTNMMQLIKALQAAGKHFEVQVGPDLGHTSVNGNRRLEFLIQSLVVKPMYGLAY